MFTKLPELRKYLLRFGVTIVPVVPMLYSLRFFSERSSTGLIGYKVCLMLIAVAFAEFIWAVFFKPTIGKVEKFLALIVQGGADKDKASNDKEELIAYSIVTFGILVFRGLLYGTIILSFATGI